ncbi:MAG: outer membrane protein transport protein [Candidatus Kapaibacterium sp.]
MYRISLLIILIATTGLYSQNIDGTLIDAIRYSSDNKIVNTRSAGLGFSYMGILNDVAAIHYNPAGLALNNKAEISVGTNFQNNSISSNYLENKNNTDTKGFNFTNISISSPVRANYQNLDLYNIGVSYSNSMQFNQFTEAGGFNTSNSYINSESKQGRDWTEKTKISQNGVTFINDSLYQDYELTESGSNHDLTFALATEYFDGFAIGGSINFAFGSYKYVRFLDETDTKEIYQEKSDEPPYSDIDKVYHTLEYNHDYTSISFNLGLVYTYQDNYRFSLNLNTPANMRIEEYFYEEAEVLFDDKSRTKYNNLGSNNTTLYDVLLPWSIAFGSSYNSDELTVAAAFQFKNYSGIQFLDTQSEYFMELNNNMHSVLDGNIKFGLGVEYQIPYSIVQLRGGATFETSPFDNNSTLTKLYSGGVGLFLFESLRVDFFGQLFQSEKDIYLYDSQIVKTENNIYKLGMGLTYRY